LSRGRGLERWLGGLSPKQFRAAAYLATAVLFLLGVWLHVPYGGGHIYSDLVYVFQGEQCTTPDPYAADPFMGCIITIPYIQSFTEYPVIAAMFLYVTAELGTLHLFAGDLLANYYYFSALFLFVPCLLAVRELLKLIEMRGVARNRIFWYFIITPTFIYMTMLNWYIIGVWLCLFGIRKYLEGSRFASGLLMGLSAASNFVTAVPALGLFIASRGVRDRLLLAGTALGTYGALNAPFVILNGKMWLSSFQYIYNWNVEDSWMQAILPSLDSPVRHFIPPVAFAVVVAAMLWLRFKRGVDDPVVFAFISMFGYAFATYIYTPQMNLILLPFFLLLPVTGSYLEFLAFDISNSLIIIIGFSQALLPFGITYPTPNPIDQSNVVYWIEVVRSLWEGKFTFFNGAWRLPFRRGTADVGRLDRKTVHPT